MGLINWDEHNEGENEKKKPFLQSIVTVQKEQKEEKNLAIASFLILTWLILWSLCQAECQLEMPQLLWSSKFQEL